MPLEVGMSDSDKFAIAARLFVQLRRKASRSIDTVWLLRSSDYAREVVRIARAQADDELHALAAQFEQLLDDAPPEAPLSPAVPVLGKTYIGTLR
jgi:hypothetical protein